MRKFDFNCFCGNWPFRRIRHNTIDALIGLHSRCGIAGGLVSASEAIFYQDPYEAEQALAVALQGTEYMHAMILNPMLPGWRDDLHRAVNTLSVKAIRLVPGYHGYRLTDTVMEAVSDALRRYKLPLIITLRIEHVWSSWMIAPRPLPEEELQAFLERNRDIPTLLAYVLPSQLEALESQIKSRDNLFIDTAGFRSGLFPVEDSLPKAAGKIVFGSCAPFAAVQSFVNIIEYAEVSDEIRHDIYSGRKFFESVLQWQ